MPNILDVIDQQYNKKKKENEELLKKMSAQNKSRQQESALSSEISNNNSLANDALWILGNSVESLANSTLNGLGYISKNAGNLGSVSEDLADKYLNTKDLKSAYYKKQLSTPNGVVPDQIKDKYDLKYNNALVGINNTRDDINALESLFGEENMQNFVNTMDNNAIADFLDKTGDALYNAGDSKFLTKNLDVPTNKLTKFAGDVIGGAAGMIPSIAGSLVTGNPSVGLGIMAAGAAGSGQKEALADGANLGDSALKGLVDAGVEVATEKMFGGIPGLGIGSLDDAVENTIEKYIKSDVAKKIAKRGADVVGEGIEEFVSEMAGEYTPDIYKEYEGDKDILGRAKETLPDALYAGLVGGATSLLMNGANDAINSAIEGANPDLMRMVEGPNEPTKVINEDFLDKNKTPIQENIINNSVNNNVNDANTIQNQLQNVSQTITPNNLDLNQNDLMNTDINDDNATDVLDMLLEQNNQNTVADNAKLNDASVNEQSNINTQENKNFAENALNDAKNIKTIDEQLVKDLKSKDNAIKMESQRINEETILREGRSINYDENQLTKLAKMSNDIGVPIRVVESLDKGAEGKYDNGIIYISKNCQNPIQAVLKHELLHHISKTTNYKNLENTLIKLAEKKYGITEQDGINNRIQEYANRGIDLTYEEAREEYSAVIAQDLFSDIDSIEKFVQLDLNLAQKVYNWIKEKLYQVTGNEEKEYLMKAERLYRKAFEESKNTTNNNENYLIAKNTNGEELVIADKHKTAINDKITAKKVVSNYFKSFNGQYKINSDGRLVNFNKASANEYTYSKSSQTLKKNYYINKIKLSGNMDEVIEIAKNGRFTPNNPPGKIHQNDPSIGKNGFYHYDVKFGTVEKNPHGKVNSGTVYDAELVLENNADGKTYFYDLIKIKKTIDALDITSIPTNNIVGNGIGSLNTSITKSGNNSSNNSQNDNITADRNNTSSGNPNNTASYTTTTMSSKGHSLGTNLNRMNENAELKDRVAGWDSLEKRTVKKIIDLEQDTYKGTDLNKFVQEAAKEALRTGKVSDTTRNYILNELENNNYFAEDIYDGDYQRLMDFISNDKDIIIETKYKKDAKELLARYGAKGNTYNGLRIRFSDYDNAKGQFLDSIYNELRNQFPILKEQYNPVDELEEVLKLVDEIKPEFQKTKVQEDIREYMKSEINDMMDVFENEVVYRSDKSAFDAYARKMKKENGIFNPTENIRKLLSKDAKDEIGNIDLKVDDNKYKEIGNYVEFMRNYSNYNMSITNNNDIVANKNKNLRDFLYKNTEEKVFKAGEEFADNKRRVTDRLYAAMKKYDIKPGSKESAAVQKLGEGQQQVWYDASIVTGKKGDKTRAIEKYTLEDLAKEFPEKADQERIIGMEKECRKIYDEYVDRHNAMLEKIYPEEELTYEKTKQKDAIMLEINRLKNNLELFKQAEKTPAMMAQINQTIKDIKNAEKRLNNVDANVKKNKRLEKRSNYYHHFKEMTRAENIKSIFTDNNQINIDNNLAGVSEFTRPKAKWQDYMQERSGDAEYTEDAINGLLKYIDQAEYSIAFDPVINDLREFNKAVVKYSNDAGINNSKYIEFLTDYTNDIAGKTNPYDRWLSKGTNGRKVLRVVKMLNSTAKANAVMGNLNSAVSQFYNLPNAISLLMKNGGSKSSVDLTKGSKDYSNYVKNKLTGKDITSEPISHSAFLKQRYMEDIDAKFDTSKFKLLKDTASKVMQLGDQAVAELTWYSAYEQGLRKNVESPITYADDITRRAIAGRGVGEVPLMQKSQIIKLLAPFQVEVTNQWNLMKQLVGEKNVGPLVGMFLTTSIMNVVNKALTGRTVGFDPVDVVMDVINNAGDDDDKDDIFFDALGRISGELLSNMPMGTNIATFALNDSQRTKLFGESDPTRYGTSNIGVQNFVKPVVDFATGNNVDYMNFIGNFVTPYGGKQLERAYKYAEDAGIIPRIDINRKNGITISNKSGAYNDKGQLKYAIDDDALNIAKGLAFGTYATDQGKEYIDNNYSPLSEKRTAAYESLIDKGVDGTTAYEAIRKATAIDSIKDNYGETIKNSRAAEVRKYLEDADLYDDVINAGVYEEFNLNKTIIGMTQSEFDEFYNSLQK